MYLLVPWQRVHEALDGEGQILGGKHYTDSCSSIMNSIAVHLFIEGGVDMIPLPKKQKQNRSNKVICPLFSGYVPYDAIFRRPLFMVFDMSFDFFKQIAQQLTQLISTGRQKPPMIYRDMHKP